MKNSNIEIHKFVDQTKILSQAAIFFTHVGANSFHESINATVPIIMVPQANLLYTIIRKYFQANDTKYNGLKKLDKKRVGISW